MVDFTVSATLNAIIIASSFALVAVRQVQNSLHIDWENKKQNLARFEEKFKDIVQGGGKALEEFYIDFCDEAEKVRNHSPEEKNRNIALSKFFLGFIVAALLVHIGTLFFPSWVIWKSVTGILVLVSAGAIASSISLIDKLVKGSKEYEAAYIRADALFRAAEEEVEVLRHISVTQD